MEDRYVVLLLSAYFRPQADSHRCPLCGKQFGKNADQLRPTNGQLNCPLNFVNLRKGNRDE